MFPFRKAKRVAALILLCTLAMPLMSCRSILRGDDGHELTRLNAGMTLVNHRVKPASTVVGGKPLTLEDCRRIALSNNLELGVARLEELTKNAIAYSLKTRILPHFLFTGDLGERNNLRFSYSDVFGQEGVPPKTTTGPLSTGVTSFSTGHERSTWVYTLETRWSPMDAALAYYLMKSGANDTLKSGHHKVRVAQKLVEVVDTAYFRLLSLQECLPSATQLVSIRREIRTKTSKLLENRLVKTEDYHRAEQKDIRAQQLLSRVQTEIETQRNALASVMAISPDYSVDGGFRVEGILYKPTFEAPIYDMELMAVQNRPEAYEAGLTHLNSVNDLNRTIVKYVPKVTGFWRYSRDKDKFLYDNVWKDVGIAIYFDLADWLSNVVEWKAASINAEKTQREIGAIALGIASQVRGAALKYHAALQDLNYSQASVGSFRRLLSAVEDQYSLRDVQKITVEETRADLIEAKLTSTRALGEANATLAELQSSMGTNYQEAGSSR
jgi:outer membrane protein TolC